MKSLLLGAVLQMEFSNGYGVTSTQEVSNLIPLLRFKMPSTKMRSYSSTLLMMYLRMEKIENSGDTKNLVTQSWELNLLTLMKPASGKTLRLELIRISLYLRRQIKGLFNIHKPN